ncbi:hypothetical protein TorRG33x02_135850 [Trema orientale]|uniref:Uncharacterized protein n=1 Tax=Trema orientale TaxID=63057 RepID=A0A2P5EYB2_TREOI|nr:hypothetical protein TorRG33x02_135850 [Trema orientale]
MKLGTFCSQSMIIPLDHDVNEPGDVNFQKVLKLPTNIVLSGNSFSLSIDVTENVWANFIVGESEDLKSQDKIMVKVYEISKLKAVRGRSSNLLERCSRWSWNLVYHTVYYRVMKDPMTKIEEAKLIWDQEMNINLKAVCSRPSDLLERVSYCLVMTDHMMAIKTSVIVYIGQDFVSVGPMVQRDFISLGRMSSQVLPSLEEQVSVTTRDFVLTFKIIGSEINIMSAGIPMLPLPTH